MRQPLSRDLWFPSALLIVPALIFALFLPYFPVDETRYLSVAWEMRLNDSFIVPIQNALPYAHKPPFLFWLINLDWLMLGLNEATLRFIPLCFSLGNVYLVYRIALLLWEDAKIARNAALLLASTLSYLLWSSVIMFDVVLGFWVLLAVAGVIAASREQKLADFLVVGLAIGGGILTKGPVVLVYMLPVALFAFAWMPRERFSRRWYAWLLFSLLAGIALVLAWLIPAALTGGDSYRRAILWGQTVNRMANSFAHKRPLWWYLPWIPALLLPWTLFLPAWRGVKSLTGDAGGRLVLIWIASGFVVFSLLSGKQVHYMIPLLPAFSLLMAKSIDAVEKEQAFSRWHLPVASFYLLAGATVLTLSLLKKGHLMQSFAAGEIRAAAAGLFCVGAGLILLRPRSMQTAVRQIAVASFLCTACIVIGGNSFFARYDLHPISKAVREKQEEGFQVLHQGKYHGQFHFIGQLRRPLLELETKEEIAAYAASHDKVALITYEADSRPIDPSWAFFRQPFRSKQVVLWNREGISRYLAK